MFTINIYRKGFLTKNTRKENLLLLSLCSEAITKAES